MAADSERRYPIRSHDTYCFYAGRTSQYRQVLMGLSCPNLVAFVFDEQGNLLKEDSRPLKIFQDIAPPYNIYDERIASLISEWQLEMGFQPATIRLKKFYSQLYDVGIEDYPSHFEEVLSDPNEGEDTKNDVRDSKRLWDEAGQFVLLWGNDFWLDDSGEVVSS